MDLDFLDGGLDDLVKEHDMKQNPDKYITVDELQKKKQKENNMLK